MLRAVCVCAVFNVKCGFTHERQARTLPIMIRNFEQKSCLKRSDGAAEAQCLYNYRNCSGTAKVASSNLALITPKAKLFLLLVLLEDSELDAHQPLLIT